VKEHVRTIMGPASVAFSNAMVKMSRLQAAQARERPARPPAARAAGARVVWGNGARCTQLLTCLHYISLAFWGYN